MVGLVCIMFVLCFTCYNIFLCQYMNKTRWLKLSILSTSNMQNANWVENSSQLLENATNTHTFSPCVYKISILHLSTCKSVCVQRARARLSILHRLKVSSRLNSEVHHPHAL